MKYQKHLILGISLLILGSYSVIFGQSLNEAFPSVKADSSLPLITYQVGDNTYSSKEKGTKIEIIFNSIPYSYGLKGSIILKNISSDTIYNYIMSFLLGEGMIIYI
jgi:hypothetical protein